MAKTKVTYIADDGKEFATELEAEGHNTALREKSNIEAYCTAVGVKGKAQLGLLQRHIAGFLAFRAGVPGAEG